MAVGHSTSLEYSRDNSGDLVWNSSTESYTSPKPEHLYGWTDSSITGEQLYGWTVINASPLSPSSFSTIYTKTENPDMYTKLYNSSGEEINFSTSNVTYNGDMFFDVYDADSSKIQIRFD